MSYFLVVVASCSRFSISYVLSVKSRPKIPGPGQQWGVAPYQQNVAPPSPNPQIFADEPEALLALRLSLLSHNQQGAQGPQGQPPQNGQPQMGGQ